MTTTIESEAVQKLMINTERGVLSVILYDRGDGTQPTGRLIEPRSLLDGIGGLQLWAVQFEPAKGIRHYEINKIKHVEASEQPLRSTWPNHFSETSVLTVETRERNVEQGHTLATSKSWFVTFASMVREAVLDLRLEGWEKDAITRARDEMGLSDEQVRAVCAYVFAEFLLGYAADGRVDTAEVEYVSRLRACFEQLGWGV